jgi:hypothetical protein
MRSVLASPRLRRRLAWGGGAAAVACLVVVVGVLFGNNKLRDEPMSNAPARLAEPEPKPEKLTRKGANDALRVAAQFINTAVTRHHVEASWPLSSRALRAGYTRRTWSRGEIPVVPYPSVREARWQLDYSIHNAMGLKVALFPRPGTRVQPAVFYIDLKRVGRGSDRHWVVDGWQPLPERAGGGGQPLSAIGVPDLSLDSGGKRQLGTAWIAVPLALFSLIVLIPASLFIVSWYRGRRIEQAYLRERGLL